MRRELRDFVKGRTNAWPGQKLRARWAILNAQSFLIEKRRAIGKQRQGCGPRQPDPMTGAALAKSGSNRRTCLCGEVIGLFRADQDQAVPGAQKWQSVIGLGADFSIDRRIFLAYLLLCLTIFWRFRTLRRLWRVENDFSKSFILALSTLPSTDSRPSPIIPLRGPMCGFWRLCCKRPFEEVT